VIEGPLSEEDESARRLLALLGGKWVAAALSAAASLGIADALHAAPRAPHELAVLLACDEGMLTRLLRVLAGEGVVSQGLDGAYGLTDMGALLRTGELGELARFVGSPFAWDPWSSLDRAVRSRESAFALHHGHALFPYLDAHPEDARVYHAAVDAFTRKQAQALGDAFDFQSVTRVADVGGGRGTLLVELLSRFPHLRGVLVERSAAASIARTRFTDAGLAARCDVHEGDFFEALPHAEVCVVKHVVHNWDDDHAVRLLAGCARAVGAEGVVLVVEGLLLPGDRKDATRLLDLEMLALCGPGKERTKPEMRRLLFAAGLRLVRTQDLAGMTRLLVCEPVGA
jgi:hypothetical protein